MSCLLGVLVGGAMMVFGVGAVFINIFDRRKK